MLETLRAIIQKVGQAKDLDSALSIIVKQVKLATATDVCSIYLESDNHSELVLMATDGLNPSCAGKIVLPRGIGLVSMVAEKGEPVNLENALQHPRFKLFEQLNETAYHGFCGIPIVTHKRVIGVLVVQSRAKKCFSDEIVNFLFTISAQLSSVILQAQAIEHIPAKQHDNRPLIGIPGAPGVTIGEAVVIYASEKLANIPDRHVDDCEQELLLFRQALERVKMEVKELSRRMREENLPTENMAIFDAYLLMLNSSTFFYSIENYIMAGNWAPGALRKTIEEHIEVFEQMDNSYLRERAKDIVDLGQSILDQMLGNVTQNQQFDHDSILVAEDFSLMALSKLDVTYVKGIVSVSGSQNSHIAILARAMEIPTVMGLSDLPLRQIAGCQLIVDGYSGKVFISPPAEIRREYQYLAQQEQELSRSLTQLIDKPSVTTDGHQIPLYLNMGLEDTNRCSNNYGAEGIGLFRTEYPFMISSCFPGESEQFQLYQQIAERFKDQPVIMRTLDIGGDKSLSYFPIQEENPFLGWRGIRISLDHPEIFIIQLRAMLLANRAHNNIQILLPMVSTLEEIDEARTLLLKAYNELYEEGYEMMMPKLGVMIEVPSLIFQIRRIARLVDFVSIGTNDLIQYLMAVDRNNARVANIYETFHPGVIEALYRIVQDSHSQHIPVSVCGEMASDPLACILLMGMGIDTLSCNMAALSRIKWVIRSFSLTETREILQQVLSMDNAITIKNTLTRYLEAKGLGGLVRAGK